MVTQTSRSRQLLLWIIAAAVPLIGQAAEPKPVGSAAPQTLEEERIQLWPYKTEEPLKEHWHYSTVQKIEWRDGDLEILFTQTAPCGWAPVNPNWQVDGFDVVLNFIWMPRRIDRPVILTGLCKQFIRAWVFRVPDGEYRVRLGDLNGPFVQRNGVIVPFTPN